MKGSLSKVTVVLLLGILGLLSCQQDSIDLTAFEGSLIALDTVGSSQHGIYQVDVVDGTRTLLYQAPEFSKILQSALNPAGDKLIISYSPPPSFGASFFDRSVLAVLDLADPNSGLALLFDEGRTGEFQLMPEMSPDGRSLYFVRQVQDSSTTITSFTITLERYDITTDQVTILHADALWPRVSPDSQAVVFIVVDKNSLERGLFLMDVANNSRIELVPTGRFFDIDTPFFSTDGEWVYFSVAEGQPQGSLFDKIMGVKVAYAHADHNVPSHWWRVRLDGSGLEQLTDEAHIVVHAAVAPAGDAFAFSARDGLYLLDTTGAAKRQLLSDVTYGTVSWLPSP